MIAGRSVMIQQWSPTALAYVDLNMSSEWTQSPESFNIEGNSINYTLFTKSSLPGGGDVGDHKQNYVCKMCIYPNNNHGFTIQE